MSDDEFGGFEEAEPCSPVDQRGGVLSSAPWSNPNVNMSPAKTAFNEGPPFVAPWLSPPSTPYHPPHSPIPSHQHNGDVVSSTPGSTDGVDGGQKLTPVTGNVSAPLDNGPGQPHWLTGEGDRLSLEMELEQVHVKCENLQDDVSKLQQVVDEQKHKYTLLQERHKVELDGLRQAGEMSLALIIEQHKELCKTAIMEENLQNEKRMKEMLAAEALKCQGLLNSQHEILTQILDDEQKRNEDRLTDVFTNIKSTLQDDIKEAVSEMQEHCQKIIDKKITENSERMLCEVNDSVEKKMLNSRTDVEDHCQKMSQKFTEEVSRSQKDLQSVVDKQRQISKEAIRDAVTVERDRSRDLTKQALEKVQADAMEYIDTRRQADHVIRNKTLTSLNILLTSAQQQITTLIDNTTES